MIERTHLARYLEQYLTCSDYQDYAPNGLQVEGRAKIERICTAVSASQSVIEHAICRGADALLVHHGFFWKGESPVLTGIKRQRIGQLIKNDVNLLAYHLPLDGHPSLGNNACLGRLLGVKSVAMHTANGTPRLLWSGELPEPVSLKTLAMHISMHLHREPCVIEGNDRLVQRLAWCSGAAQDLIFDAVQLKVDAFISGEISERTYYFAQELGVNYLACGHHATERDGIRTLGQHLAMEFSLEHLYIESDNPV